MGDRADLLPGHVQAVFREFLGRPASPQDIAIWMPVKTVRALVDGVLGSAEYAARVAERTAREDAVGGPAEPMFMNLWVEGLERFSRAPGTLSRDEVAIVGDRGHLFLYRGSNENLAMYRGEITMTADWLEHWRERVISRLDHASAHGLRVALLVVPDKLAVYADHFPQDLSAAERRPVMELLRDAGLPLLYPCDELREARAEADTYLLTDSHLSPHGNRLLAEATIDALGAARELLAHVSRATEPALESGDLGQRFEPPIVEVRSHLLDGSGATIVADNWGEVSAVGGHIGTLRVFRHDAAPDPRTVVVFGDSYAFGDPTYEGLSWFLAQAFREVHFAWVPFGWDPTYIEHVGAELVVCETAERFIPRVPRDEVDVRSLGHETIARRSALGLEQIFTDAPVL